MKELPDDAVGRINANVLELIQHLKAKQVGPGPGDHQTDNDLQDRPELKELMEHARAAVTEVFDGLRIEYQGFQITACWVNVRSRGGYHRSHMHPNNYLSGVYYVNVPPEGSRISFHDPRIQTSIICPRTFEENAYNCPTANLPVRAGSIVMFPAWLSHSVELTESDAQRISVSFNAMFDHFAERMSRPLW